MGFLTSMINPTCRMIAGAGPAVVQSVGHHQASLMHLGTMQDPCQHRGHEQRRTLRGTGLIPLTHKFSTVDLNLRVHDGMPFPQSSV